MMSDFKDEPPTLKSDTPISSLRARIAAVLNHHKTGDVYDEWADCQCGHVGTRWDDHVADAVIAELGLTQQTRKTYKDIRITRNITQWQPL
jgi:hypothetical protein